MHSYHEAFLRSRSDLTVLVMRLQKGGRRLPNAQNEPNFYEMQFLSHQSHTHIQPQNSGLLSSILFSNPIAQLPTKTYDQAWSTENLSSNAVGAMIQGYHAKAENLNTPNARNNASTNTLLQSQINQQAMLMAFQNSAWQQPGFGIANIPSNMQPIWMQSNELQPCNIPGCRESVGPGYFSGFDPELASQIQSTNRDRLNNSQLRCGTFVQSDARVEPFNSVPDTGNISTSNEGRNEDVFSTQSNIGPSRYEMSVETASTLCNNASPLTRESIALLSNPPNHPILEQFAEQYLQYFSNSSGGESGNSINPDDTGAEE